MVEVLRNMNSLPAHTGLRIFGSIVTSDNTRSFVVETKCKYVAFALAFIGTSTLVGTIADSTTYVGTKKVTFSLTVGDHHVLIIGSTEKAMADSITADTVVVPNPL